MASDRDAPNAAASTAVPRGYNRRELSEQACAAVYRHVFETIKMGGLDFDGRLPTERRLMEKFSTSRSTVRKALARLQADGIVTRQVGSGTYAGPNGSSVAAPADSEGDVMNASPLDVLEARLALQPGLVEFVVLRATEQDFRRMEASLESGRLAEDQVAFRRAMYDFHLCVAVSTRNPLLIRLFRDIILARDYAGWDKMKYINRSKRERLRLIKANREFLRLLRIRDGAGALIHIRAHLRQLIAEVASFDPM